jgi:glyoxylase-like metal-dependent hydrolase (beta-lactamase superfamily II)
MSFPASDRREFLRTLLAGAAGLTLAHPLFAQGQGRGPAPLTITKLTDRLAVVQGAGGNIGLVLGADGVMMIDGGLANRAADIAQTIASVSPRMVQLLFNTHYHFDHVGSNEFLGKNRVRIIAHENVRKRLGMTFENAAFGNTIQALSPVGQPTETFTAGGKLAFGQEAVEYTHTPLSHTDGDAFVFFPSANILHAGDLLFFGRYPVVDFTAGGSLAGMAGALERMEQVGDANTRIIPGHGPATVTKAQMRQTRDAWLTINQRLEQLAQQGRSVEEAIAAVPTKDFDMAFNTADPAGFLRQAYGGVLARRNTR